MLNAFFYFSACDDILNLNDCMFPHFRYGSRLNQTFRQDTTKTVFETIIVVDVIVSVV